MLISSLENDRLSIYLYKVIEFEVEHTGEAVFELFWKKKIEDGLDYHFRKNLVGYVSDGGSNMKYTFFAKLCLALERTTITQVHCGNHRLELASKNSFKQEFFLKFSDEFMNKLYRFYNSALRINKTKTTSTSGYKSTGRFKIRITSYFRNKMDRFQI